MAEMKYLQVPTKTTKRRKRTIREEKTHRETFKKTTERSQDTKPNNIR